MSYFCILWPDMQRSRKRTLEERIALRIQRQKARNVFVRSDFRDLGGYDQVGRGLKRLADRDRLVRIGYGLYARSAAAPISRAMVPQQPLPMLAAEALDRLKVKTAPSTFDRAYNEGTSTQVPTGRVIAVKGRFSRKIRYGGQNIVFERSSR